MRLDSRSKQILLVESVPEGKEGLLSALVERYRVSIATSAYEAVRLLTSHKTQTDLVLVLMDEDAGICLDILQELRGRKEQAPPVLAVLSDHVDSATLQGMFEAGLSTAIDPQANAAQIMVELTRQLHPRAEDQRQMPRAMAVISVFCIADSGTQTCQAINIGAGGIFVRTDTPFALHTAVEMRFTLPEASHPCHVQGEVRRVVNPGAGEPGQAQPIAGMGVRFLQVARRDQLVIEDYVDRRRSRQGLPGNH